MQGLILAIQFLTIIPIRTKKITEENKLSVATIYFPLVGILLGLILIWMNNLLSLLWLNQFFTNAILITLLIILTGGLHLDGLADTVDALASRKDKTKMLKIMRDSHIGTMGVLSLVIIILLKLSVLCSLGYAVKNISLILMCLLSRYALVLSMFLFPYAREEGKAKIFIKGMNIKIFSLATLITLCFTLIIFGLKGLIILTIVVISVILLGKFVVNKIAGITGDTLGAISELTEVFVLLNILFLTRS